VAYGSATVLQAIGVRRFADAPAHPVRRRLWAGRLYAVGLGLDGAGFLASVLALRTLPLFVVESAIASSVAVTAVLSAVVLQVRLSGRERLALACTAAGLVALAVSASEGSAVRPDAAGFLVLLAAVPVGVMLAIGWRLPRGSRLGVTLLSAAAGLGFGGVGVAARVLELPHPWWHAVGDPLVIALVVHTVLAMTAYAVALERGRASTVAALTFAVETLVPAAIGLVWLGDAVRPGPGWAVVAGLGFVATLGGSIALASHAEPPAAGTGESQVRAVGPDRRHDPEGRR
jgi:drug/metabolite transporter (DMT)-like permease